MTGLIYHTVIMIYYQVYIVKILTELIFLAILFNLGQIRREWIGSEQAINYPQRD